MRRYSNELTNDHGEVTGFQSACAEFAESSLSLDERFNIGDPGVLCVKIETDYPFMDLQRGNLLIVNRSQRPQYNDLLVLEDAIIRFKTSGQIEDKVILGVITAVLKDLNPSG